MIYATPSPRPVPASRLGELADLRASLGDRIATRSRWMGSLRREVRASSIESSTSIEGFSVSPGEALALVDGRDVADRDQEDRQAVACYARAMDHVGTMGVDPSFRWVDRVILDLHFDACHFQRDKDPGLWRTGPIGVTADDGSLEFEGPEGAQVVPLMREVLDWLERGDRDVDVVVRAAMAHLHVVSVHPFRDGNGRVARIVQSLVLARDGLSAPEFFSIEDYLGSHTREYYAALREAQGGGYRPDRDATGWVAFCVDAHIAQARQRLEQIEAAANRWTRLEDLVDGRDWPERLTIALEQSLVGGTDRGRYADEAAVSPATASADFRRLLDAGLVEQSGRGRSTGYRASKALRDAVEAAP
jgi:Fic family protein